MPEGTYNPVREASLDAMESKFGDEMDDEQASLPISPPQQAHVQLEPQQHQMMESDDGHVDTAADLVRSAIAPLSRAREGLLSSSLQPDAFPETARRQVPGPGPNQQPHVRRKSVIPLDASILKELASHKSCVPSASPAFRMCSRLYPRLDDGSLAGPTRAPGGAGPAPPR